MSFNIGDTVRATQYLKWGSVPAGTTGVVADSAGGGDARVDFGSHGNWWYDAEDLALVEADPKYKAGDKVRFTETRGGYGDIEPTGVIVSFDPATSTTLAGYMVECRRPGNDGRVNRFFCEDEIAGLVEEVTEEQFVDRDLRNNPWEDYVKYNGYHGREAQLHYHIDLGLGSEESQTRAKELLAELYPEDPFAREGVIYRRRSDILEGLLFRLVGDSVQSYDTELSKPIWAPAPGWEDGFREGDFTEENFEVVEQGTDTRSSTQPDGRSEMNRKMDTVREAGERRRQKLIAHTHKLEAVIRDRNAEIGTLRAALSKVAQVASDEAYKNVPMHTYPF